MSRRRRLLMGALFAALLSFGIPAGTSGTVGVTCANGEDCCKSCADGWPGVRCHGCNGTDQDHKCIDDVEIE